MNTLRSLTMSIFLLLTFLLLPVASFAFDSGSSGADGALNVPASPSTYLIPLTRDDGVYNYTTVTIPAGVTVTFPKNSRNTPITILATGDVSIGGTIDLKGATGSSSIYGAGGPGGFNGGDVGAPIQNGRRGEGPGGGSGGTGLSGSYNSESGGGGGGGYATAGSTAAAGSSGGNSYGNDYILPLIGGSGGGAGGGNTYIASVGGGGGGGAILIASSGKITINGSITANGGAGSDRGQYCDGYIGCWFGSSGGGGSGGSIRLIAGTIAGTGLLSAVGGNAGSARTPSGAGGAGANGRIRLEANTLSFSGSTNPFRSYNNSPALIPSMMPTLTIASITPANPPSAFNPNPPPIQGGSLLNPDLLLPFNVQNPVTMVITGTNIQVSPTPPSITVTATPLVGSPIIATAQLTGTFASSSATITMNIPTAYPFLFTASVTTSP